MCQEGTVTKWLGFWAMALLARVYGNMRELVNSKKFGHALVLMLCTLGYSIGFLQEPKNRKQIKQIVQIGLIVSFFK